MKASLSTKLHQLATRLEELNGLLAAEDVTRDLDRFRALSREHSEISPVVTLYRNWQEAERDLTAAQEMLADPAMRAFGDEETKAAKARMETLEAELQSVLLPRDPNDERNIFIEIRAGTGGEQARDPAGAEQRRQDDVPRLRATAAAGRGPAAQRPVTRGRRRPSRAPRC